MKVIKKFKDFFKIQENIKEKPLGVLKTKVSCVIKRKDGKPMFMNLGENATLVGGTQDYVKNIWNIQSSDLIDIPNLDSEFLGLETPTYSSEKRQIFGFGLGIDGAVGSTILAVKRHSKGYEKDQLIAFDTVSTVLDDTDANFARYAFRAIDGNQAQYFIKKFAPSFEVISAKSKAAIPDNPSVNYTGTEDVRCHTRIETVILKEECNRWFGKNFGSTDTAHFNSIILFAGRPCTITVNSKVYNTFRDIIATNKINFKDTSLVDTEVKIIYDLYYV